MDGVLWKTLVYQGKIFEKFDVSTDGKIRNSRTCRVYKTWINKYTGYEQICVSLGESNKKKIFKIHKAVAETFISNPENKPEVNHKDGNKLNNNVDNLEWVTSSENMRHAIDTGLLKPRQGIDCSQAKLTVDDVHYIRECYIPYDPEFGARALARKFGVTHSIILKVLNYVTYVNV